MEIYRGFEGFGILTGTVFRKYKAQVFPTHAMKAYRGMEV
jgi:hypothetical protein